MSQSIPSQVEIIVAGQICLDVILMFGDHNTDLASLVVPGKCVVVNNSTLSTGGAVANTGGALHRLGIPTRLISKIGADIFGQSILQTLEQQGVALTEKLIIDKDEVTSYSIVLNPPGIDRSFLYIPGANHTFSSKDVKNEDLRGARYFHLGYPPEMQKIYANGGLEFRRLMKRVKHLGLTTSLDMAFPDANTQSGKVDWREWLEKCLPFVDIFLPSIDEILFMLDRPRYKKLETEKTSRIDLGLVSDLAGQLLSMGVAMAVIKLGAQGIYLQTTGDPERLASMGLGQPSDPQTWLGKAINVRGFKVEVAGTTGAGDCAVAGFLAGISKDLKPEDALTMAAAAGACGVEQADACSGVPHWDILRDRVAKGWAKIN